MTYRYVTLDVFTDRRFGGNPLAVVLDARGLDAMAMQAIAREFNYSETSFVLPPEDPAHTARLRIFTPGYEMPFAGHPTIGSAVAVANERGGQPRRIVFEETAGPVPVLLDYMDDCVGDRGGGGPAIGAELTAPQTLSARPGPSADAIAAAAGIPAGAIVAARHAPMIASVGVEMLFAEVASRAALAALRPDAAAFRDVVGPELGLVLYTPDLDTPGLDERGGLAEADLQARMVFWQDGVVEDPATGSAAAALAALLATFDPRQEGDIVRRIAQGVDMGRPSLLRTRAVKRGGAVVSAHVGGRCVEVMRGEIAVD